MKNVPKEGLTLEDLCRIAAEYAVYIHIGVALPDVGKTPIRITIQLSSPAREKPSAFSFDLEKGNPRLNYAMSVLFLREVRTYAPQKLIVL
jgi:hypothetical protein